MTQRLTPLHTAVLTIQRALPEKTKIRSQSKKHVLRALQKYGIAVAEEDLIYDGRKKGKARKKGPKPFAMTFVITGKALASPLYLGAKLLRY